MHDISSFDYDSYSPQEILEILEILRIQEQMDEEIEYFISNHLDSI